MSGRLRIYRKVHRSYLRQFWRCQYRLVEQRGTNETIISTACRNNAIRVREYETIRRVLSRKLFRTVRFFLGRRALVAVSAKPKEMRMGKGKGGYAYSVLPVWCGSPFARFSWCHRAFWPVIVRATQSSVRKSGLRLYY